MGEDKNPRTDNFFQKLEDYIGEGISRFVAFLFFTLTVGAIYGFFVAGKEIALQPWLLIAPAVVGLIAYYNRAFSVVVFIILVIFVFIL